MLSHALRAAINTSRLRQYQLAHLVGVHPATLSAWMNGIYQVSPDDPRLRQLAQLVGLPSGDPLVEVLVDVGTPTPQLTQAIAPEVHR
jgi:transcriptional regulator with XRE-family HTH domain